MTDVPVEWIIEALRVGRIPQERKKAALHVARRGVPAPTHLLPHHHPCVYLVETVPTGPIKIGSATDIFKRIINLQIGNPHDLRVLVTLPFQKTLERDLQDNFKPDHIRGEWFRRSVAIIEFVEEQYEEYMILRNLDDEIYSVRNPVGNYKGATQRSSYA